MKNKKVAIICPYPKGCAPSQRLKYEQYLQFLESNGYKFSVFPFFSFSAWKILYKKGLFFSKIWYTLLGYLKRFFLIFKLNSFDILYIHLWVTPIGLPFFEWIYSLLGKKIIYDIDDLVFLGVKSKANASIPFLKTSSKTNVLLKYASHVITCTPYLDQYARKFNPNTTDISSTVNLEEYQFRNKKIDKSKITLGWSGSHSTSQYLNLLKPVFDQLSKKYQIRLIVIGDDEINYKEIPTISKNWNRNTEVEDLSQIDIGLYPLPDEQWVYGKSGLKAIQYMALGIPTIATNIGTISRIIENKNNGFLVDPDNLSDWIKFIQRLIEDEHLYQKISKKARNTIEERFSVQANQKTYLKVFNSL